MVPGVIWCSFRGNFLDWCLTLAPEFTTGCHPSISIFRLRCCPCSILWLDSSYSPRNLSICLSHTPFSQYFCHRIIMKFSGTITTDRSNTHAKDQGQGWKVKFTEIKEILPQFGLFWTVNPIWIHRWLHQKNLSQYGHSQTVTPVWIHRWLWNDAPSLV